MFIMTDEQYKSGVLLDEYNGTYSIVQAKEQKDGEVYKKWCCPKISKDKYADKDLPLGIRLGNLESAIDILESFLHELKGEAQEEEAQQAPDTEDDIPF